MINGKPYQFSYTLTGEKEIVGIYSEFDEVFYTFNGESFDLKYCSDITRLVPEVNND